MKQLTILLISILSAIAVSAQLTGSSVTFTVEGNKNLLLSVDDKSYNLTGSTVIDNKTTILIADLVAGQHKFQVTRTDRNRNRSVQLSSIFILRARYDMLINLNSDGSLELIETRKAGITDNHSPMTNANFSFLLRTVKNQRSATARNAVIADAFNKPNNYFTAYQVSQLIQQVVSENDRLQLTKSAYPKITDPDNFYILYDLLKSQNSRNELEDYVNNYYDGNNPHMAMSEAEFNILYQDIKNQWPASTQLNSLTSAFNHTGNYFTAYQASRLIQIVNGDNNRLALAKLSYRSITDRNNFSQVVNLLSSQYNRDELTAYINNYGDGGTYGTAMPDADFNTLYQDIKNQWPVSTQVNSLNSAFSNTNYFFTSYQASRLIQIVSGDNNRLPLAKLSYRSITDRNNFSQVVNLLSSQYNRDELTAYINNYGDGGTYGTAMSDAGFNTLYQDIKNQWPVSTQVNSLSSAFNNTNYFFTSYQASRLIQIVTGDNNRLPLAKLSYRSITDRNNFSQVVNLLSSQYNRDELTAYVNNYGDGGNYGTAMSDASFNTLYQDIKNQWPASSQLNSLTSAFNNTNNYFTSYQVSRLIQLVTGDNSRLSLAKLSYRSITDRNNFSQVINLLSYQSSRDELTAYVNSYSGGGGTRVAMSESDFNVLYQNIQLQFLPGAKMAALTNTFNNTNYYFTVAQAKQLIPMVSLESNRLELAKLSYRSITDRNNFSQVYELLDNQSDRNELDAYVKAYRD